MSKKDKKHTPLAKSGDVMPPAKAVEISGKNYTRKAITLQLLSFGEKGVPFGQPIAVEITGPIHDGKRLADRKGKDGSVMKPIRLCNVASLETGEERQLICNAVLESSLDEAYPDNGYVNKLFEITCNGKVPGKRYMGFNIAELTRE